MIMILKGDFSRIEIEVLSIQKAISNDFWENNWLSVLLIADFPGFKINLKPRLRKDEFAFCMGQLKDLLSGKSKEAFFYTIEEEISFHFFLDENGNIKVEGELNIDSPVKCFFKFVFLSERFHIRSFVDDMEAFLKENPIIGKNG